MMQLTWARGPWGPVIDDDGMENPDVQYPLAEGVIGYTMMVEERLHIPLVTAVNPGSGDVSRWLDTLPTEIDVVFPCVINQQLEIMLRKRGYVSETWKVDLDGTGKLDPVEVMIRRAGEKPEEPEVKPFDLLASIEGREQTSGE